MFAMVARMYMSPLNMYFRGFLPFAENESGVGEFFSLFRLAGLVLLPPVAGAGFLIQ